MHTFLKRTLAAVLLTAAGWAGAAFPERSVHLVVPFPPGGAADLMARTMAQGLGDALGQTVVVENRGGGGGSIGAEAVARAPADGYMLFFGTMGTHAINSALYPKLRYDPIKDFTPISVTHVNPRVLVVGSHLGVSSIDELIKLARSKPTGLTYGSAGNGSTSHLAGALFESLADVKMTHVPYKGSAPLLVDILAGRIDLTFDSYTVYEKHIEAGKVRAIGVTSTKRLGSIPDVPTIAESGLAGYEVSNWLGVLAPAGVPADVVARLHEALGRAMADKAMRERLVTLGIEPVFGSPEAFADLIRTDKARWAEIVKQAGAVVD